MSAIETGKRISSIWSLPCCSLFIVSPLGAYIKHRFGIHLTYFGMPVVEPSTTESHPTLHFRRERNTFRAQFINIICAVYFRTRLFIPSFFPLTNKAVSTIKSVRLAHCRYLQLVRWVVMLWRNSLIFICCGWCRTLQHQEENGGSHVPYSPVFRKTDAENPERSNSWRNGLSLGTNRKCINSRSIEDKP